MTHSRSLSICAVARNEGRYITEWVSYHLTIGIDNIVIYDNNSEDNSRYLLQRLSLLGYLTFIDWNREENVSPQLSAFQDYVKNNSQDCGYTIFMDLDEFIAVPDQYGNNIKEYFRSHDLFDMDIGAVAVNQRVFGSSGEANYRTDYVMKRFTKIAEEEDAENCWFKSFARPNLIKEITNPHFLHLKSGRYVTVTGSDLFNIQDGSTPSVCHGLRLNHYILKSLGEFRLKQIRGGGAGSTPIERASRYTDSFFFDRDKRLNNVIWDCNPYLLHMTSLLEDSIIAALESISYSTLFCVQFDFGDGAPAPMHLAVNASTVFRPEFGFGWITQSDLQCRDRHGGNKLTDRFVMGSDPATFRVIVPPGIYHMVIGMHDPLYKNHRLQISIDLHDGEAPKIFQQRQDENTIDVNLEVRKTILDIEMRSIDANWIVNSLIVRQIGLHACSSLESDRLTPINSILGG